MESGWPTNKASVPESVRPYWDVRSEPKSHEELLYKQDRVVIPTTLHSSILHKLHAAHRGPDFTLRHARNTVFWPGLTPQFSISPGIQALDDDVGGGLAYT